jgi:hypothetical protein
MLHWLSGREEPRLRGAVHPVTTSALKLEVDLPEELSAGLFEWEVK